MLPDIAKAPEIDYKNNPDGEMIPNWKEKDRMKAVRSEYLMMLVFTLVISACASQPKNQIMLMPAPDVFDQGEWDPFTDRNPIFGKAPRPAVTFWRH